MKRIILVLFSVLFAQSLEVDGDLTVSGQIQSESINTMDVMKPDKIYRFETQDNEFNITVPENKMWKVVSITSTSNNSYMNYNNLKILSNNGDGGQTYFIMLAGDVLSRAEGTDGHKYIIMIYEYPISGSGTSQGMDYIIP